MFTADSHICISVSETTGRLVFKVDKKKRKRLTKNRLLYNVEHKTHANFQVMCDIHDKLEQVRGRELEQVVSKSILCSREDALVLVTRMVGGVAINLSNVLEILAANEEFDGLIATTCGFELPSTKNSQLSEQLNAQVPFYCLVEQSTSARSLK